HLNYKKQNKNRIKNQLKTYFGLIGLMGLLLSLSLSGEVSGRRPVECIPDVMGSVDEGDLTSDQQLGLKQAEERLQRDYIHRLAKQSPDYPNFQYLCKLCSVHVDNIQGAHKHIKEKRHKKNIMVSNTAARERRRLETSARLAATTDEYISAVLSQRSRFPLTSVSLLSAAEFSEVESDFHAKVPVVFCRDAASGLPCKVSAGNDVACLTTNHLAALARLEPRLVPLVLAFRYWAKTHLVLEKSEDVSLGQLWLELLRFYTLDFALEDFIISIRLKELLPRDAKNWPRRRLAIEDPFALKRNVARSLNSQMVFEYIQDCFRMAYRYFACPQSRNGLQAKRAKHREEDNNEDEEEEEEEDEAGDEEQCVSSGLARLLVTDGTQDGDASQQPSSPSPSPQNGLLLDSEDEEQEEEGQKASENDRIAPEDLHYVFDRMIFTGGKPPTVVCSICKRDGHLKDDCPEDFKKMELAPLPSMTERFREILDNLCRLCFYELSPTIGEQQKREQILASLERFIRKEYNDKAQLCLFGSSKNGFGFRDSDLDICMTLEGHDTAEKLNCKEIIEGLAKVLKKHTGLRNILPITTAKVPIVKFEHKQSGLEGDISLYNTLRCDIGDASRGSLSSYAYILMVLYFLQQREPPVIPVLQEIYDGNSMPQRMVDGWNAFFFDDMDELRRRLPEFQQNRETVGELWLGLLRFYTEEFDFKEHVISIRQRKRLTTFEKQWTSKCIAIEDPFDLNHNLGAGVSRKMTNFIMKAFINGRKLFGTPFYPQPGMEAEYFFDSKVLTDGELAPNDRCCRICGKIGHYMKDCPKRRRMKKKENDKDEDVREEDREPRERRCFQCGDMGHVRRDCPDYRHLRQRGAPAPVKLEMFSLSLPTQSDTRQTPPYSPQPSSFSQSSVSPQSSQSAKPSSSGSTSSATPSKPPQPLPPPPQQQVQLSVFGFPTSHPGQFHPALGLLQSHAQPAPNPLAPGSWPLHGASTGVPMRKGKGNAGAGQQAVSTTVNLNDPSIIFAQPAGRGGSVGGPARDGGHHWHNHHLNPGALVANGTVGKAAFAGVAQPGRSWEHSSGAGSFSLSPSWPYRMPQTYLQQPGKPFISQGTHGGTGAYGAYENEGPYKE
uniref:CCHC-type domain-containing protein n=1 Tax=Pygocentrus nattereri TaxID=42514 RepID=A0AAR2J7R4_PYGNA